MEERTFVGTYDQINLLSTEANVDWLTITAKSAPSREALFVAAIRVLDTVRQDATVKPWKFKGYTGWHCEGNRWATRPDSDIFICSGDDAALNWRTFLPLAENVSRVDLACTCKLWVPWEGLAGKCYEFAVGIVDFKSRRLYTHWENSRTGDTLYIGSRSSPQYGRLYDKGVESGCAEPGQQWRYEVEFKDHRARAIGAQLLKSTVEADALPETLPAMIASTIRLWFRARGVETLFDIEARPLLYDVVARVTDDQVKLEWLSTQVSPTVQRLIDRGKRNEVLVALGLDWLQQHEEAVGYRS